MRIANAHLDILFIAGFGPIVRDTAKSRKLYGDVMGIPFKEETGEYLHTEALAGAKTFALWPLSQAARSCFGKDSWPDNVPLPQAWLEFDVGSVERATAELESKGYQMLVKNRKEPWGQVVSHDGHDRTFIDSPKKPMNTRDPALSSQTAMRPCTPSPLAQSPSLARRWSVRGR